MSDQDPVAWLRAQIEARHELALLAAANRDPRGSGKRLGGEWETGCTCKGECPGYPRCEEVAGDGIHIYAEGGHDADQAEHIAANDPQDTIARCEAELAILDEHARLLHFPAETLAAWRAAGVPEDRIVKASEVASCARCHTPVDDAREDEDQCLPVAYPCRTVRLLAGGYQHRPGYEEAGWKA